jgi:hypothetical protein
MNRRRFNKVCCQSTRVLIVSYTENGHVKYFNQPHGSGYRRRKGTPLSVLVDNSLRK